MRLSRRPHRLLLGSAGVRVGPRGARSGAHRAERLDGVAADRVRRRGGVGEAGAVDGADLLQRVGAGVATPEDPVAGGVGTDGQVSDTDCTPSATELTCGAFRVTAAVLAGPTRDSQVPLPAR